MSEDGDGGSEDRGGKIYPHPEFDGLSLVQLALEMNKARLELDAAKEAKSKAQKKYDYLRMAAVPKAMGWDDGGEDKDRLEKFRPEGGRGITIYDQFFVSVLAENRLNLQTWLRENNAGSLVVETVNSSTLKAFVTDCVKNGKAYPADLIKLAIVPTAKFY